VYPHLLIVENGSVAYALALSCFQKFQNRTYVPPNKKNKVEFSDGGKLLPIFGSDASCSSIVVSFVHQLQLSCIGRSTRGDRVDLIPPGNWFNGGFGRYSFWAAGVPATAVAANPHRRAKAPLSRTKFGMRANVTFVVTSVISMHRRIR
jgi:hypothetical protein